jgi:2-dehydro-3-deoxyphosphogluconate aldolase/(4S)-4-hydroxy-2-oxoglutarate aldolase
LKAGGLNVVEITFRTAAAQEAIRTAVSEFSDFTVGAGTVTSLEEVDAVQEAGAGFAVSPGLSQAIVRRAHEVGLTFFPGVCTPTDIHMALDSGCKVMKYFPAAAMNGIRTLKAVCGPFLHLGIRFIPTGGINAENMTEYLSHPAVLAVGGSWIVAPSIIADRDWQRISELARQAVEKAS